MENRMTTTTHEQYEEFRETAAEYYQQGRKVADEYGKHLEEFVREEPVKALAMAVGVGIAVGLLFSRR